MTKSSDVIVLKFGSSVLSSEEDLPLAINEIQSWRCQGWQVIAVVSAFGDTTNDLIKLSRKVCEKPKGSALAVLLASGEATSSALLGLALARAGIAARVLDAAQAGLRTTSGHLDADLVAVNSVRLRAEAREAVLVLPGFVGRDEDGATTLLGRGGSDYTALFLSRELEARCLLLKDVDGLYTSDPAISSHTCRFAQVSYETALRLGGGLVQQKAVRFAATYGQRFLISRVLLTICCTLQPGRQSPGSYRNQPLSRRVWHEALNSMCSLRFCN